MTDDLPGTDASERLIRSLKAGLVASFAAAALGIGVFLLCYRVITGHKLVTSVVVTLIVTMAVYYAYAFIYARRVKRR